MHYKQVAVCVNLRGFNSLENTNSFLAIVEGA